VPNESEPDLTLFLDILRKLEFLEIPYVIIGGFAAAMYGITRVTFDIDIIVNMKESHIQGLAAVYPLPRYYADPHQMRNAMRIGSSFNIIDAERGEKADIFPLTMDLRYQPAFDKRVRRVVALAGTEPMEVWAARPEDVIVGKLMAWAEGRSQRQAVDIFEMMLFYYLGGLEDDMIFDEANVSQRAAQLDEETLELWQLINESAREEASRH
jgi:hypothetical protein